MRVFELAIAMGLGAILAQIAGSSISSVWSQIARAASPIIDCRAFYVHDLGSERDNWFQRVDRYSIAIVALRIENMSPEVANDVQIVVRAPDHCWIERSYARGNFTTTQSGRPAFLTEDRPTKHERFQSHAKFEIDRIIPGDEVILAVILRSSAPFQASDTPVLQILKDGRIIQEFRGNAYERIEFPTSS